MLPSKIHTSTAAARLAGLGNLLVDETLWRGGLEPAPPGDPIADHEGPQGGDAGVDRDHAGLVDHRVGVSDGLPCDLQSYRVGLSHHRDRYCKRRDDDIDRGVVERAP